MTKVLLSWSSGKDSAWTLGVLRDRAEVEVVGLLTTINEQAGRVAMHAVRRELLEAQADAVGLPLWTVPLPWPCSNAVYEELMAGICRRALDSGVEAVAFGDLFLQDVRAYRERQLAGTGLQPLFPLWERPTGELAREMIGGGLRAILACVDPRALGKEFAGREFDESLLRELPATVDPCGENGEFHTFVYDGPGFRRALAVDRGEVVEQDGFVFADIWMTEAEDDRSAFRPSANPARPGTAAGRSEEPTMRSARRRKTMPIACGMGLPLVGARAGGGEALAAAVTLRLKSAAMGST